MDLTIIVPTLNEKETVQLTIFTIAQHLKDQPLQTEILIVDDDSKDGTADVARKAGEFLKGEVSNEVSNVSVNVIVRKEDHGLSKSVIDGFKLSKGDIILVMDCDGSHPFEKIIELYNAAKVYDVVIGSRYMIGGGIGKWSLKRKIISKGATFLARLLYPDVTDPVSGFFAFKRTILKKQVKISCGENETATFEDTVKFYPLGYKILMEVLGRGNWKTFKEVPYVFEDRKKGGSKLTHKTIIHYIKHVIRLFKYGVSHTDSVIHSELRKIFGFAGVGISGIAVNLIAFKLLLFANVFDIIAAGISTECAIISNFLLNDTIVFRGSRSTNFGRRFGSFQLISIGGLLINTFLYTVFTRLFGLVDVVALVAAIFIVFVYNFLMNRKTTWGK